MIGRLTTRCPSCRETEKRPSHRHSIERLVGTILALRPFRCPSCHVRFWGLQSSLATSLARGFLIAVLLCILYLGTILLQDVTAERARRVGSIDSDPQEQALDGPRQPDPAGRAIGPPPATEGPGR